MLTSQTEARAAVPVSVLATVETAVVVVVAVSVSLLLTRPAPAVVPAEAAKRRLFFRSKRGAAERVSLTVADCVYRSRTRSASTRLASECEWTVFRSLANTAVAHSTSVCVLRRVCIRVRVRSSHERTATAQSDHSQPTTAAAPAATTATTLYCNSYCTRTLSLSLSLPSIDPACRVSDERWPARPQTMVLVPCRPQNLASTSPRRLTASAVLPRPEVR